MKVGFIVSSLKKHMILARIMSDIYFQVKSYKLAVIVGNEDLGMLNFAFIQFRTAGIHCVGLANL